MVSAKYRWKRGLKSFVISHWNAMWSHHICSLNVKLICPVASGQQRWITVLRRGFKRSYFKQKYCRHHSIIAIVFVIYWHVCLFDRTVSNPCGTDRGGCEHICVLSHRTDNGGLGYRCRCRMGYDLHADGKRCVCKTDLSHTLCLCLWLPLDLCILCFLIRLYHEKSSFWDATAWCLKKTIRNMQYVSCSCEAVSAVLQSAGSQRNPLQLVHAGRHHSPHHRNSILFRWSGLQCCG